MKKNRKIRTTLWLRIILLLCGLVVNFSVLNSHRNVCSDFVQDYIAANSLRLGSSLYGEDFKKLEMEMLGFNDPPNFHPPSNALLFLPLSILTYKTSYVVLGAISIILLLLINCLIVRGLEFSGEWFLNITCFTLFWYPVFSCLGNGQSSIIITACLIGGWFCLRLGKAYFAGLLFAIPTLMKLFPGLVLLYLLMIKNWRAFFAMVFFIILGLLVTAFVVGVDDIKVYSIIMVARDVEDFCGYVLNHSVAGIVSRAFGGATKWTEPLLNLSHINSLLIVVINLAVLSYTIFKIKVMAVKKEFVDYAFALTLVAMLLLSPITWGHIFPVLILPISLLLKEYIRDPSPRRLRMLLFIILLLSLPDVLIARGLMAIHHPFRMPWYAMLLTLGPSAGIVLLWIVLIRCLSISKFQTKARISR